MEMWILILTLTAPGPNGGTAIAQVPGFHTEQACVNAGNVWLSHKPITWAKASAVCVPSK